MQNVAAVPVMGSGIIEGFYWRVLADGQLLAAGAGSALPP